jgi:hypothetical protein
MHLPGIPTKRRGIRCIVRILVATPYSTLARISSFVATPTLVWECDNFTGSSVPLIESLKSEAHLMTDVRKRKNSTRLQ